MARFDLRCYSAKRRQIFVSGAGPTAATAASYLAAATSASIFRGTRRRCAACASPTCWSVARQRSSRWACRIRGGRSELACIHCLCQRDGRIGQLQRRSQSFARLLGQQRQRHQPEEHPERKRKNKSGAHSNLHFRTTRIWRGVYIKPKRLIACDCAISQKHLR
jgi:hypothetical protein